jgi:hypothetical protein
MRTKLLALAAVALTMTLFSAPSAEAHRYYRHYGYHHHYYHPYYYRPHYYRRHYYYRPYYRPYSPFYW